MSRLPIENQTQFLQLIMDHIPQFIFWKDLNLNYLGCNLNFARSANLAHPKDIIGKSDYDMPWSKEDSDFYRATDQKIIDTAQSIINFEEPQTIENGKTLWLRTSKIPLFDTQNKVIGVLGMYEDITQRKEMELQLLEKTHALEISNQKLLQLNQSLEQANIDLEHFSYATSHDLQEPLLTIGSFSHILQERYADKFDEKGKSYLNYIIEGVQRMSKLTRGILNYTRLSSSSDSYFELNNIEEIVMQKWQTMQQNEEIRNAQVNIKLPSTSIYCNRQQIETLFYNLIENAIKFNASSEPLVDISFEEAQNEFIFKVSDNGIGVLSEKNKTIFDPFKRLNNLANFSGNGLGLSICKRIVNLHGGEIEVFENENKGCTFVFSFSKNLKPK